MLPSFSFPVVGVKRERERKQTKTNKEQSNKLITHIIQASMAEPWIYQQNFLIYTRACAMYKKCLSPSVLVVEPDVSGE